MNDCHSLFVMIADFSLLRRTKSLVHPNVHSTRYEDNVIYMSPTLAFNLNVASGAYSFLKAEGNIR